MTSLKKIKQLLLVSSAIFAWSQPQSFAQGMDESGMQAYESLEKIKSDFQNSNHDSLFISKNSDAPFRKVFLTRGEQSEDVEEAIFNAKSNQVVGPFNAGTHNYLFKVVKLDSMRTRWHVGHIFIKPKGFNASDTLEAFNEGLKIAKDLNKGADFSDVLKESGDDFKKLAEKVRLGKKPGSESATGWLWEGTSIPNFDKVLLKARKGEAVVAKSNIGIHVFQVTEKQMGFYKAVVYTIVKKVEQKK
jgi:peptidyl-prolyl cis-trans isomerase D